MKPNLLITVVFFTLQSTFLSGTTWTPQKHTYPICNVEQNYYDINSYGGYIYRWPSKYQYVYWPLTDIHSIYCCTNCCFTSYLWDFDNVSKNQIEIIKQTLSKIKLSKKYEDYLDIPIIERLEIAEKIYQLRNKDDEFWCQFYRVQGYHYERDFTKESQHSGGVSPISTNPKQLAQAKEARRKSLQFAFKLLNDETRAGQQKEIYYIIAAMYNNIDLQDSALFFLDKAMILTYTNNKSKVKNADELNKYLGNLILEYKDMIKNKSQDKN